MDTLIHHPWPGNIRELQNFIERAVILTKGDVLEIPPLPTAMTTIARPVTLGEAERDHILKALVESSWAVSGKTGAAARLGLSRTTLIGKMQKFGLSRGMARSRLAT